MKTTGNVNLGRRSKLKIIENGLVPVYQRENGQAVDARELHEFLGIDTRFNDWIRDRIEKYDFARDVDFISFTKNSVKGQGGRPTTEYILTLDTAKEIAMVQNNERGSQARKYFIAIEKKYKQSFILPANFKEALLQLIQAEEYKEALQLELTSKNQFINQIAISENSLLVREVAKIASKSNINIGEKGLWGKLREWGLIFKKSTEPMQRYINNGYFEVVEGARESKGKTFTYHTTRIKGAGQTYIIDRLIKEVEHEQGNLDKL